ncbi:MAG: hypothetical protein AAGA47_09790, partial [Pseudomonadota bacterium]
MSDISARPPSLGSEGLVVALVSAVCAAGLFVVLWLVSMVVPGVPGWGQFVLFLVLAVPLAYAFRAGGQAVTSNAPRFRDMGLGVAYGYVIGAATLGYVGWTYIESWMAQGTPEANTYFFFRVAIHGFAIFAIAAFVF